MCPASRSSSASRWRAPAGPCSPRRRASCPPRTGGSSNPWCSSVTLSVRTMETISVSTHHVHLRYWSHAPNLHVHFYQERRTWTQRTVCLTQSLDRALHWAVFGQGYQQSLVWGCCRSPGEGCPGAWTRCRPSGWRGWCWTPPWPCQACQGCHWRWIRRELSLNSYLCLDIHFELCIITRSEVYLYLTFIWESRTQDTVLRINCIEGGDSPWERK